MVSVGIGLFCFAFSIQETGSVVFVCCAGHCDCPVIFIIDLIQQKNLLGECSTLSPVLVVFSFLLVSRKQLFVMMFESKFTALT